MNDIKWHMNCADNAAHSVKRLRKEAYGRTCDADRVQENVLFTIAQIEEAKRQGKEKFDSEKFLKKNAIFFQKIVRNGVVYKPFKIGPESSNSGCFGCSFRNTSYCKVAAGGVGDRPVDCKGVVYYVRTME